MSLARTAGAAPAQGNPTCHVTTAQKQQFKKLAERLKAQYVRVRYHQSADGQTYTLVASNAWTGPVRLLVHFYDDDTGQTVARFGPRLKQGQTLKLGQGPNTVRFRYGVCVSACLCTYPPESIGGRPAARSTGADQATAPAATPAAPPSGVSPTPSAAPAQRCPQGSHWTGATCQTCPPGSSWNGSECRPDETTCASGLHHVPGEGCVPDDTDAGDQSQPRTSQDRDHPLDDGNQQGSFSQKMHDGVGPIYFDKLYLALGAFVGQLPGSFSFNGESHGAGARFNSHASIYGGTIRADTSILDSTTILIGGGVLSYAKSGTIKADRVTAYGPPPSDPGASDVVTQLGRQDFDVNTLYWGLEGGLRFPFVYGAVAVGATAAMSYWWISAKNSAVGKQITTGTQNWDRSMGVAGEAWFRATFAPACHFAVSLVLGHQWSHIDYWYAGAEVAFTAYNYEARCPR